MGKTARRWEEDKMLFFLKNFLTNLYISQKEKQILLYDFFFIDIYAIDARIQDDMHTSILLQLSRYRFQSPCKDYIYESKE